MPPQLAVDRELIEHELESLLPQPASDDPVSKAMHYAVFGSAQRVRPILSLRISRLLGVETAAVRRAAAAAELIHCASLIIDDLPCMDNSSLRRGRPSVHIRFGEAMAILSSFALVALAARCVVETDSKGAEASRLARFQRRLLRVLDPHSLVLGQALDLESPSPAKSALISELKTAPLFDLAVDAGGVSSAEYESRRPEFRRFARAFGLSFQMVDDLLDRDADHPGPVLAQLERARRVARELGQRSQPLTELVDYLDAKVTEDRRNR